MSATAQVAPLLDFGDKLPHARRVANLGKCRQLSSVIVSRRRKEAWALGLLTATDSYRRCFPNLPSIDHGDHAPAQHIVAAELKLHSCGA